MLFPTASLPCRHSLAVAQGLIATAVLDLDTFDVTRLFHDAWLIRTHSVEAYASARLSLSMRRPSRRLAPSGAVPTETRAERVQALVSEARVTAQAAANDPRLTLLLRRTLAAIYREASGLSTDESGRVELVMPLAGTTGRAREAAGVSAARGGGRGRGRGITNPLAASGPGRGRSNRFLSAGEAPAAKRKRGEAPAAGRGRGRGRGRGAAANQ